MKVAICVPCRDQVHAGFSFDLARLVGVHAAAGMDIGVYHAPGTLIVDQRIMLAKQAIFEGATDILWIDSDMRFPKDALQRLLARNKKIVAANYPTRVIPVHPTAQNFKDGEWSDVPTRKDSEGLEKVTVAGMGLMLTSVDVFKALPDPWFALGYSTKNGKTIGEDVFLCMNAAKAGFDTYLDHDISKEVKHIGTLEFVHEHVEAA